MAKHIILRGMFVSRCNTQWRVEIWNVSDQQPDAVGELSFAYEDPLIIERGEVSKEKPLAASTATLRVISPGDRTYTDLYTERPGTIGVDVFRNDVLHWSGSLDPEFYEEPYESRKDYIVSLTFSDFGSWGRMAFGMEGVPSLMAYLRKALDAVGLGHLPIDISVIDTMQAVGNAGGEPLDLERLAVQAANFYDEDDEPSTWREVIEAVLQPLGLRIVQIGGKIWIYDLAGLFKKKDRTKVRWESDAQTLGVDRVYNDAKITFSPYSRAEVLDGKVEYTRPYGLDAARGAIIHALPLPNDDVETELSLTYGDYAIYPIPAYWSQNWQGGSHGAKDFILFLAKEGKGFDRVSPNARYFKTLPLQGGGTECEGIAWCVPGVGLPGGMTHRLNEPRKFNAAAPGMIFKSKKCYLPASFAGRDHFLRLTVEMLLDERMNPFQDIPEEMNEEFDRYHRFQTRTGWLFIPLTIRLHDESGAAVMHYTNAHVTRTAGAPRFDDFLGEWKMGAGEEGAAWLAYYSHSDPAENAGIHGWHANRPNVGRPDIEPRRRAAKVGALHDNAAHHHYDFLFRLGEGQPLPYPPIGGWLSVTLHQGFRAFDYGEHLQGNDPKQDFDYSRWWDGDNMYREVRWMLFKAPKIEIARAYADFKAAEIDDITTAAVINPDAAESLDIGRTMCGTHPDPSPAARGRYIMLAEKGKRRMDHPLRKLIRAGYTGTPEILLLNTIFSQFARRAVKLSGLIDTPPAVLQSYVEGCQPGKQFILAGATEYTGDDTTDAVLIELKKEVFSPQYIPYLLET